MATRTVGVVPLDISVDGIRNQELLAVAIGKHHIDFTFDAMSLTIEGGFEVNLPDAPGRVHMRDALRDGSHALTRLLGCNITRAFWVSGRGLCMKFDSGAVLWALVDGSGFESFSFSIPGEPGIVVV